VGLVEPLARPDAAWVATEPEKRLGCLMVNTSSEVSPHIRSVARVVSSYLGDLRALLRRACVNARTRGEVDGVPGFVDGLRPEARRPRS